MLYLTNLLAAAILSIEIDNHFDVCTHCSMALLLLNGYGGKKRVERTTSSTENGKSWFYDNNLQVNIQTRAHTHKLRTIQFVVIEQQFRGIKMTYYKFIS